MEIEMTSVFIGVVIVYAARVIAELINMGAGFECTLVNSFKLSYYETTLELNGHDISHVKDITAKEILR